MQSHVHAHPSPAAPNATAAPPACAYACRLLAYGVLAGGTLTGKYSQEGADTTRARHTLFPGARARLVAAAVALVLAAARCCCRRSAGLLLGSSRSCATHHAPGLAAAACLPPGFQPRYHAPRSQAATKDLVALAASKGISAAVLAQAWAASR